MLRPRCTTDRHGTFAAACLRPVVRAIVVVSIAATGIACSGYPFETRAETPTPRSFVNSAAALVAHAEERRAELASRAFDEAEGIASAAVILARPLAPGEARAMFAALGVNLSYFEWLRPGTQSETSGADSWSHLQERQAEYPGLMVIFVHGDGRLSSLQALANDDRVWLVDLGGTENVYWLARDAGLVADTR